MKPTSSSPSPPTPPPSLPTPLLHPGNCHNCGKPGHWARSCPQKQSQSSGPPSNGYSNRRSGPNPRTEWSPPQWQHLQTQPTGMEVPPGVVTVATVATPEATTPQPPLAGRRPSVALLPPTMVAPSNGANIAMMARGSTPPTTTPTATLAPELKPTLPLALPLQKPMQPTNQLPGMPLSALCRVQTLNLV